jgi:putative salt-induced outer membrane protein YdiY
MTRLPYAVLVPFAVLTVIASPVRAQDTEGFTWTNATELSFVSTSGNQSQTSFGLKGALEGSSDVNAFKLEVGGVRASSTFLTRRAEGTSTDFVVNTSKRTEQSAASYYARARYDRNLTASTFLYGGGGWERNTFAGFNHRYSVAAGVGKAWVDTEESLFKTDVGATYTLQKDVEVNPDKDEGYFGLRANIEGRKALSASAEISTILILDESLTYTEDFRADWTASVSVDLIEGLAFKTSYQILFDNDPALVSAPLFTPGGVENGTVLVPSKEVDTFLTLSLVIKL